MPIMIRYPLSLARSLSTLDAPSVSLLGPRGPPVAHRRDSLRDVVDTSSFRAGWATTRSAAHGRAAVAAALVGSLGRCRSRTSAAWRSSTLLPGRLVVLVIRGTSRIVSGCARVLNAFTRRPRASSTWVTSLLLGLEEWYVTSSNALIPFVQRDRRDQTTGWPMMGHRRPMSWPPSHAGISAGRRTAWPRCPGGGQLSRLGSPLAGRRLEDGDEIGERSMRARRTSACVVGWGSAFRRRARSGNMPEARADRDSPALSPVGQHTCPGFATRLPTRRQPSSNEALFAVPGGPGPTLRRR